MIILLKKKKQKMETATVFPGCVVLGHTNEDDYHGPRKNMDILQNVNIGENWLRNRW